MLVKRAVRKNRNTVLGTRLAVAQLEHFGLDSQGIAAKQRFRKTDFIPAEIRHRRTVRRVVDRYPDHEAQGKAAVDQRLAEFRVLHVLRVEMQRGRIVRHGRQQHIVGFGNGPVYRMVDDLADLKFLKIQSWHWRLATRFR